jgi:hypothetical protein
MCKGKQHKEPPLDLALVIGLKAMIKRLVNYPSLDLEFSELAVIEEYETGPRRQAIKHIRATMLPHWLGFRPKPRPKKAKRQANIGDLFRMGAQCLECKTGTLENRIKRGKNQIACSKCKFYLEYLPHVPRDNKVSGAVAKYLSDLRNHQIISAWHQINDPDPLRF